MAPVQVTKVTSSTFAVSQYDVVFAVKVSGTSANQMIRGFYCVSGTGIQEFDNTDPEWNIYKGSADANQWKEDAALAISYNETNNESFVGLAEGAEGDFATSASGWPLIFGVKIN